MMAESNKTIVEKTIPTTPLDSTTTKTTSDLSPRELAIEGYRVIIEKAAKEQKVNEVVRQLCLHDIFYLGYYVLLGEFFNNDWVFERCREFQADSDGYLDLWPREHFKDLPMDTPMLTQNRGWTTHGDLQVGDTVFAPSGKPVRVIALSPRYHNNKCLKVNFRDGKNIVCGHTHLWRVIDCHRMKRDDVGYRATYRSERIVEARDLRPGDNIGAIESQLEYPEARLPIPPYTLGAWLGDGHSKSPRITCAYKDLDIILAIFNELHTPIIEQKKRDENTGIFAFGNGVKGKKGSGIYHTFRELNLHDNKHIPDVYKTASIEQRMELMRGLMDTDGSVNERGNAMFSNINKRLIDDVYELAASLALRPRLGTYQQKVNGEPYTFYEVSFQLHRDRNVFKLHRKAWRAIAPSAQRECRTVASVEEVESVPTSCIQVEGGMYLAGRDFIPTHNSTIITLVAVIWRILNDPEITVGIFSFTRPIAKAFLRTIKSHFESNERLKKLFPDILYADPEKESPKWSEDDGIVVKRKGFPKEMTVEASGVVDGMPTSKHYALTVYDDVETDKSVTTPEMSRKVTEAVNLSFNLGKSDGTGERWMLGTRYHYADTYAELIRMGAVKLRLYAATKNGKFDGEPWLWSREVLAKKIKEQGTYIASCQLFNNPVMEGEETFKPDWVQYWNYKDSNAYEQMNRYIVCDPAGEKNKTSDYTTMFVYGLSGDHNYYVIDMVRDKLSLSERCDKLMRLHMMYHPIRVGYEKYGMQSDIEYLKILMEQRNYRFPITPLGGMVAKNDRIKWLQPIFEANRFYLPETLMRATIKGGVVDLTKSFLQDEYYQFPFMAHDDMLDCASRIMDPDMGTFFPDSHISYDRNGKETGSDDSYEIDTYGYIDGGR